jgi:hypothetical protein
VTTINGSLTLPTSLYTTRFNYQGNSDVLMGERDQVPAYKVTVRRIRIEGLELRYQAMLGQIVGLGRCEQGVQSVE